MVQEEEPDNTIGYYAT